MKKLLSAVLIISFALTGCASIMNGTTQSVGISSNPADATVTINGVLLGNTPVTTDLKRKENHTVRIDMEGYKTYSGTFTKKVSGWVWGNVLIGGLIGLAIDAISGGLYTLTPEQLQAELKDQGVVNMTEKDTLYIMVVLEPDPGWQQVASLERIR